MVRFHKKVRVLYWLLFEVVLAAAKHCIVTKGHLLLAIGVVLATRQRPKHTKIACF